MAVSSSTITSILNAIGSLGSGGLLNFHAGLSAANEMVAMRLISNMQANPAASAAYLPALLAIPGLPPQIVNYVTATPPNYTEANNALLAAVANEGFLSKIIGG